MNAFDILIAAIYLGLVWYVYQSIVEEVTQATEIVLDKNLLKEQLTRLGLQDQLSIELAFKSSSLEDTFNDFEVKIENKTFNRHFAVHWNRSTLVDFDGVSQRIIRLPSTINLDLYQAQVESAIAPLETFKGKATIENSLTLKENEAFIYEVTKPIFSTELLKAALADELIFEVTVMLQCSYADSKKFYPVLYPVICSFRLQRKPWQKVVYWKPKSEEAAKDKSKKKKAEQARKDYKQAKDKYREDQRKKDQPKDQPTKDEPPKTP